MIITGYHGTSIEAAEKILNENRFELSDGDKEWLGTGIYFYEKYADAFDWAKQRYNGRGAVLHAIIEVKARSLLDIDSASGKELCRSIIDLLASKYTYPITASQKNQCAIMNYIWRNFDEISVIIAGFPKERRQIYTLSDFRERRREFCIRDNSLIKKIDLL